MTRQSPMFGSRGGAQVAWLWVAAVFVLVLGLALMVIAVNRQPPLVQTAEVLPAPTIALPTMPAGMPAPGQYAIPQGGAYPGMAQQPGAMQMPQTMPGGMPPGGIPAGMQGGMPAGMPPGAGGMMPMPAVPPPTAVPTPTPTPPIVETFACQEGLEFKVEPEEAVVTINGEVIGRARLFGEEDAFEFPGPGTYYVRVSSPGYKSYWFKVNVGPGAEKKTKKIEVELSKDDD